ncbi:tRNA lysidine(34) synthetase TilS [Marinicellulosiphila megalodicopiae]|uniref:tRNA lysidine(34) synthetase TilS n=1 Tax=Marinicellulosiphila megalodicopiae TaxID=2724896 RepID=UPI003BB0CBA6
MLLTDCLTKLKKSNRPIFLGYSGGVDSEFLFDCLIKHGITFTAIHIHHGLQVQADHWQQHCRTQCSANNIAFITSNVKLNPNGKGIEDAARQARIEFFIQCMNQTNQTCTLILAHHQDDQLETFFLRLMRGASLQGLSAMQDEAEFYGHKVARPLLEMSKQSIIEQSAHLNWVEDPTNQESKYDRNFLRNQVLPLLKQRWPHANESIEASIKHIQSANAFETAYFINQVQHLTDNSKGLRLSKDCENPAKTLYFWLTQTLNLQANQKLINELLNLTQAKQLHLAKVIYQSKQFIFDGEYLRFIESTQPPSTISNIQFNYPITWNEFTIEFKLNEQLQQTGLKANLDIHQFRIDSRPTNQKLSIFGRHQRRDLKRLLQEIDLPWTTKQNLPYIFYGQELIAIGHFFIVNEYASEKGSAGIEIICN